MGKIFIQDTCAYKSLCVLSPNVTTKAFQSCQDWVILVNYCFFPLNKMWAKNPSVGDSIRVHYRIKTIYFIYKNLLTYLKTGSAFDFHGSHSILRLSFIHFMVFIMFLEAQLLTLFTLYILYLFHFLDTSQLCHFPLLFKLFQCQKFLGIFTPRSNMAAVLQWQTLRKLPFLYGDCRVLSVFIQVTPWI